MRADNGIQLFYEFNETGLPRPIFVIAEGKPTQIRSLMDAMLKRWNKSRTPKPEPLGTHPSDRRAHLYRPTAIVNWTEKVEGYLTVPKSELIQRLTRIAVRPERK